MGMTEQLGTTKAEVGRVTTEKLAEELRAVVADLEELVKVTASQTEERVAAARAKAEESLKAAKARLAKQEGAVMAKTKATAKAAEDYVRSNPWKAVGIAAGVGFVLCLLATRFGQSAIEAGERVIIKGGQAIQGTEKKVQKFFKQYRRLERKPIP